VNDTVFLSAYTHKYVKIPSGEDGMSDKLCTSCKSPLAQEGAVEFGCPACGTEVYRCYRCREQSVDYVCKNCGFQGP
jgi:predicted RNA-binding Zn-ribbon protein involved in translation (DUF1610 family)